ncbi:MAG: isochorismatase family cysteine hydrolase [Tissierellia bacterium]|nr:isochorismatase family cysteine hydrolase [Tissierellia bacterium]
MDVLVVVDMQNDFVTGSAKAYNAEEIVKPLKEKYENFDGKVIFTRDTHYDNYLSTVEGKKLPIVHCKKGTWGWELIYDVEDKYTIINKESFGSVDLMKELEKIDDLGDIYFAGICTDICVISNAIMAKNYFKDNEVYVYKDLCRGVEDSSHQNALSAMKVCHINII